MLGTFDQPWAMAVLPRGTNIIVTEKAGNLKHWNGTRIEATLALHQIDYGGQGGLGDVVLAPDFEESGLLYLSWAEAGGNGTRGAVVARGQVDKDGLAWNKPEIIWRQSPKVTGRGHYSHRIAISPDGKYLYVASGDRQKFVPAQDLSNNLGKVLRLNLDGTPAAGNPFAEKGGISGEIWSYGHRNILGLQFDAEGRLWALEHGPAGGDELNLIKPGQNYGWPLVSDGDHYDGKPIPRHAARPDLAAPAISWNPVIAPGDFIFYSGKMWPEWKGQALIAALGTGGLVRVGIEGEKAFEAARYPLGKRIRAIREASDGSLYVLEDGSGGRLLRLSRK